MKTYLDEDNEVFNTILEQEYFTEFKLGNKSIELELSGLCSANCQYCYLKKYQKDLFPKELYNEKNIIDNINLLLQWYIKNNFTCRISLFSGEWLTTSLMEPVFNSIYNNFKDAQEYQKPIDILIPDNMNFIHSTELTDKIQYYIDLLQSIHIPIIISASIDGKYCDFGRVEQSDEFYQKCFEFCDKNNFFCHPMISPQNIKNWKENYLWWLTNAPQKIVENLVMLETKNENWDNDSILALLDFCNFLIESKLIKYNNDLLKFANSIFYPKGYTIEQSKIRLYNSKKSKGITCTMSKELSIRVADLSLILCHRLSYEELLLGKFIIEDNQITKIQANKNKVPLLSIKAHFNRSCAPLCEKCIFEPICPGFCCGLAYETFNNILVPTPNMCNMYKTKYIFLIKKYNDMGIFDLIENNIFQFKLEEEKHYILSLRDTILNEV